MQGQKTEEYVREARMVVLAFFVDDISLKRRANDIVEAHVETALSQYHVQQPRLSVKARTQSALFDFGVQYFKRYAKLNWERLMNDKSRIKLARLQSEIETLTDMIAQLQSQVKRGDREGYLDLGTCLTMKVKSERIVENLREQMFALIDSPLFTEKMLSTVVLKFWEDFQLTQPVQNPLRRRPAPFKPRQQLDERQVKNPESSPNTPQSSVMNAPFFSRTLHAEEPKELPKPVEDSPASQPVSIASESNTPIIKPGKRRFPTHHHPETQPIVEKPTMATTSPKAPEQTNAPAFSNPATKDVYLNPLFIEEVAESEVSYTEEELKRSRLKRLKKRLHSPFRQRRSIPAQRAPWRTTPEKTNNEEKQLLSF